MAGYCWQANAGAKAIFSKEKREEGGDIIEFWLTGSAHRLLLPIMPLAHLQRKK
jgi:hypothetical protein